MSLKTNLIILLSLTQAIAPITIMLSPFGDAKKTGRIIDDCFERSLTLKFAEAVKVEVEKQNKNKNIKILLNRVAGEILEPLQNANFANRLEADFYFSINFFKENGTRPQVYLFSYASSTFNTPIASKLTFVPFDEAFRININSTHKLGSKLEEALKQEKYKHTFDFKKLLKIPFAPLVGIKSPSIAFEASLKTSDDWKNYVIPIAEGISLIIQSLK